jgi:hypothetical protein
VDLGATDWSKNLPRWRLGTKQRLRRDRMAVGCAKEHRSQDKVENRVYIWIRLLLIGYLPLYRPYWFVVSSRDHGLNLTCWNIPGTLAFTLWSISPHCPGGWIHPHLPSVPWYAFVCHVSLKWRPPPQEVVYLIRCPQSQDDNLREVCAWNHNSDIM